VRAPSSPVLSRARRAHALRPRTIRERGSILRKHVVGREGEAAAADHLIALGFRIERRNLRTPDGEIDIVAREGDTLVFVEVKSRTTRTYGNALGAVDARKRRRIRAVAEDYLQFFPPEAKVRFDVVTIDGGTVRLHRGAFT
jgi:putative endonuclease